MVQKRTVTSDEEFRGTVLEFMRHQDEVNVSFNTFLTNHFPHFVNTVGELNGKVKMICWALGATVTILVAAGVIDAISLFK